MMTIPASPVASGLKAVILAGGKGVRLRPFTASFPKPLVPLGEVPIIEVLIRRLVQFGITDITLTLGHLSELIKAYFHHRADLTRQITLHYVDEDEPTGTAGSLSSVNGLDDTFIVMNGDVLTDLDFHALVAHHRQQRAALTIAVQQRQTKIDFGVLEYDSDLQVTNYYEKPERRFDVSMGIYVYEPKVLRYIAPNKYLDFPELVARLLKEGERVSVMPHHGLWLDIGRPDDYARAQDIYSERKEGPEFV